MFAYNVFKVLYAPNKAFREIAQNPRYIGPILVMILFIAANMAFTYVRVSKTYVEQTLPAVTSNKNDEWTENATFWNYVRMSGIAIKENAEDFINASSLNGYNDYYGNKSIEFSINESATIWMQLGNIGTVDCSEQGYSEISLRIKLLNPSTKPENATFYLLSTETDYFYYDFTDQIGDSGYNVWNNVTVTFINKTEWHGVGEASWSSIKGLRLNFSWPQPYNVTLLVDGLFFRGIYYSQANQLPEHLFASITTSFMQFIIQWVIIGGLVYIMAKLFHGKTIWKTSLILVGFALITFFIQAVIYAAAFTSVPTLQYRLELLGGVYGESENAYKNILTSIELFLIVNQYASVIIAIWTIALLAIATRVANEFSWSKSAVIAVVAYYVGMLITSFLMS